MPLTSMFTTPPWLLVLKVYQMAFEVLGQKPVGVPVAPVLLALIGCWAHSVAADEQSSFGGWAWSRKAHASASARNNGLYMY